MTRKDFDLIAGALKKSRVEGHGLNTASTRYINEQWELTVECISHALSTTNDRFDHSRFVKACHGG